MPTLSHKIRLYPTKKQEEFFRKSCGCSRFVYNWALSTWKQEYEAKLKPSGFGICNKIKDLKDANEWLKEVSIDSLQRAVQDLDRAFKKFFKKQTKYPKLHKKGKRDSFYLTNQAIKVNGKKLKIPKVGSVNLAQELRLKGKVMSCTISRIADRWFASIAVELLELPRQVKSSNKSVGLDLGIKTAVVTSDGVSFQSPKPLNKYAKKLKRQSQTLNRRVKGSNNRNKAKMQLSKTHAKIARIRQDFIHKVTSKLIDENQVICLEDLNVAGMVQNHKLARSLSDISFGEIRRQLEYKAALYGREVRFVDTFFPSSKTCSNCGIVKESLSLGERTFKCNCGFSLDRDINAAINIRNFAALRAGDKIPSRIGADSPESGNKCRKPVRLCSEVGNARQEFLTVLR